MPRYTSVECLTAEDNLKVLAKMCLAKVEIVQVIDTFQLKVSEDQLMSRCTKCNGKFIQKPLSTQEAVEAAKGFQVIPNCLFNKNLEFWQCMDCKQLYWEVTLYVLFFPFFNRCSYENMLQLLQILFY